MEFLLLIYRENEEFPEDGSEEHNRYIAEHRELYKDLCRNNQYLSSNALGKAAATTTVRVRSKKVKVSKGPLMKTEARLTGYYLIDCESLEEAIEAAGRIPDAARGSIEVRPIKKWEPDF